MFVFPATYILWFLSEIFLSLSRRSEKSDKNNADRGSLGLIWAIIIAANVSSYYISVWFPLFISENQSIRYVGLVVILIGVLLRFTVVATLGKFFTVNVTIRPDHKLKTDGLYKYVRHPSYSASILSFVGYGISLNNWLSLLLITASVLTAFMIRIRIEERTLVGYFGDEYLDYMENTKRLIPFVF